MLFFFNTPVKYPRFLIFVKFAPLMGVPLYILTLTAQWGSRGVGVLNISVERLARHITNPLIQPASDQRAHQTRAKRGKFLAQKNPGQQIASPGSSAASPR